ncbi:MAG: hypothetical protein HKP17_05580 [Ignavibacteriaceae bacterium]|nr:hypothetical protein [Ignavibacteriaceae bacterium]
MMYNFLLTAIIILLSIQCTQQELRDVNNQVKYNIIEPGNGIYAIVEKDVNKKKTTDNNFETVYYDNDKIVKIERYNKSGELTDEFDVAAVTQFEYNLDGNVKYLKYFDKKGNRSADEIFGYWSVEYVYDEHNRVRMELYRDANSKFLEVPRDNSGDIAKVNFLSPVLTYEYIDNKLKIKALDQNFNLLKEVYGDKPCVPFIDCGEVN